MKDIKNWLANNKAGVSILAGVAAIFILLASMNGCEVTDVIKVNVPPAVQKATNSPPKVTLTDAPEIMETYVRGGQKFRDNIARGYEWLGFLSALSSTGIEFGKSAIPGGAIGLSLLTLVGGIMIKGPGTAKEKNKSYNKGMQDGKNIINAVAAAVKESK